jgi:hypothetical protein
MIALTTLPAVLEASVSLPLPKAEEVMARLEKAGASIKNLSVTTDQSYRRTIC